MGAYDRLLDHYYATESALPSDIDSCCRIARAMTKDERKSVIGILSQYFKLTTNGYVQSRAEKEITDAQPAMVAARLNGGKGGRPKSAKNETKNKPSGLSENNQTETQLETSPEPEPYLNQKLIHTVETLAIVEPTQIGRVCSAIKSVYDLAKQPIMDMSQSHPTFTALIEAGATVDEFTDAASRASKIGKGFGYMLGIVKRQREEALNLKLHKGAMPALTSREAGRNIAAKSVFTPENTKHLQGNKLNLMGVENEVRAVAD